MASPHPTSFTGTVLANRRVGAYRHLTITAEELPLQARPGNFVAIAVGDETSGLLLRRCISIHRVTPGGLHGGTFELVVAPHGPGTRWITARPVHSELRVIGPLGRAFPLPTTGVGCVVVGGGYGSAPLQWLAHCLRERGCQVEAIFGAGDEERLFGVSEARAAGLKVTVTTDDGSSGVKGWVSDVLPDVMDRVDASVIYGCGPMPMLKSISEIASARGAIAQVAVEEAMACGIGVCMTCVMPVRNNKGVTSMVRSCVEGPVFRGERVRWEAFTGGYCHVPEDTVGAPVRGGH